MRGRARTVFVTSLALCFGCTDDGVPSRVQDAGSSDAASALECTPRDASEIPEATGCAPGPDHYAACVEDAWPPCISDDGAYHRIRDVISTIARVEAFEEIAALLFDPTRAV